MQCNNTGKILSQNFNIYYLYIKIIVVYLGTKHLNKMTTQITTQKMKFIGDNEVKGWFKLTDGTKTNFHIQENGEVKQWGDLNNNEIHPVVLGLLELLFSHE